MTESRVTIAEREMATEIRRLKTINADLSLQNEELRKGTRLSPAELEDIARIRAEHASLKKSQDEVVVFLRKNFTTDMESGVNRGMGFAEMVCRYLALAGQVTKQVRAELEQRLKVQVKKAYEESLDD